MRKIWLAALAAAVLIPTGASAQSDSQRDENWQQFREANEELYRLPAYQAPRGQRYQRTTTGAQLAPAFYAETYYIKDFAAYRLPAPGKSQQYIRYGNDVLLMNIRTGTVLRVYRAFFL